MSISYGLNLGIMNGAADGDLYGNAMRAFQRACDAFLQPIVKGYLTNTPPGSPVDGDMYIVGSAPTGSWASYVGYIAKWSALLAAWEFYLPKNGWQFQSNSSREIYRRTGGAWEIFYQEGTYTPNWTAATTNPAIGNGSISGSYVRVGKLVTAYISLSMGSTTTFGSGQWYFSLPTPVALSYNGVAVAERAGFGFSGGFTLGNPFFAVIPNGPNEFSSAYPHAWGANDTLKITHHYKEA